LIIFACATVATSNVGILHILAVKGLVIKLIKELYNPTDVKMRVILVV